MGKASRDKGAGYEREIVNAHKALGVDARRIPLSGAMKDGFQGDVQVAGYLGECKRRKDGFKTLYDWIQHDDADMLFLRSDGKQTLAVLTWDMWTAMLKQAGLTDDRT